MRKINTLLTICAAASMLHAQPRINPDDYKIDAADVQRAEKLIAAPVPDDMVMPTRHPDAQWYPGAALGLFMHWGIHSVDGIQPSWNMIKHYRYGGKRYHASSSPPFYPAVFLRQPMTPGSPMPCLPPVTTTAMPSGHPSMA